MGIPKFFRWISSKCPALVSTLDGETKINVQVDHFYIDMNGILYLCKEKLAKKYAQLRMKQENNKESSGSASNSSEEAAESVEAFNKKYEEDLILHLFLYIEEIVYRVKPAKTLFIAVDGVAPCAKVQQQRQRRWHSYIKKAKKQAYEQKKKQEKQQEESKAPSSEGAAAEEEDDDDEEEEENAESQQQSGTAASEPTTPEAAVSATTKENSETTTSSASTESEKATPPPAADESVKDKFYQEMNFTPGTPFMHKLTKHLEFFIKRKMQDDKLWQKESLSILLSGADFPGEGEHKVMDFIRQYHQNSKIVLTEEKHVMYGMDADLIMLGLATHVSNFFILREFVMVDTVYSKFAQTRNKRYVKNQQRQMKKQENQGGMEKKLFQLFNIRYLREFIHFEFKDAFTGTGVKYDLERLIDDFILMLFLCGNDFLPHVYTLDIGEGALEYFFSLYKPLIPQMKGYITNTTIVKPNSDITTLPNIINFERLAMYLEKIAKFERSILNSRLPKEPCFRDFKNKIRQEAKANNASKEKESTSTTSNSTPSNISSSQIQTPAPASPTPAATAPTASTPPATSSAKTTSNFKMLESHLHADFKNLVSSIDFTKSEACNCSEDLKRFMLVSSLVPNTITPSATLPPSATTQNSKVDEQILLKLAFKKPVKICSILVTGVNKPTSLKLYVEKPHIDFQDTSQIPCNLEVKMPTKVFETQENLEVKLTPNPAFNKVSHLTIFISDNVSCSKITSMSRLILFGYPDAATAPQNTQLIPEKKKQNIQKPQTPKLAPQSVSAPQSPKPSHQRSHHRYRGGARRHKQREDIFQDNTLLVFPKSVKITEREGKPYIDVDVDLFKKHYYDSKFCSIHAPQLTLSGTEAEQHTQKKDYILLKYLEGITWIMYYYFYGTISWTWFYPCHYAPFASDLHEYLVKQMAASEGNFGTKILASFEIGSPLKPYELLASVIPPSSLRLLPPILQQYFAHQPNLIIPKDASMIPMDKEGQRDAWEHIALVPFIDHQTAQVEVANAFATLSHELTEEEKERNVVGYMFTFKYEPKNTTPYLQQSPISLLPNIDHCVVQCKQVPIETLPKHLHCLKK